jgi:hypothetical protein
MSGEERLDGTWHERDVAGSSSEFLVRTLRRQGVPVDEERLRQAPGPAEALILAVAWMARRRRTSASASFLSRAILELWRRCDSPPGPPLLEGAAHGLPRAFHECFMAAPLEIRLALAQAIAVDPRFDGEDALELGRRLRGALHDVGRGEELEGILATWEAMAPHAYRAEPALLGWRVEYALKRPGADVHGALLGLAAWRGHLVPLLRLAEWCLYRGHVQAALAGLTAAWPGVRDSPRLFGWDVEDFAWRAIFTTLDAALLQEPAPGKEWLRERLEPFGPLTPGWLERALAWRSSEWAGPGGLGSWAQLSQEQLHLEQQALVMAFERELRARHGWPLGRTQLLHPWLLLLLPEAPGEPQGAREAARAPAARLLPPEWVLHEWAGPGSDSRYRHPHAEAAVAAALLPWGRFLRQLGLIDADAHAAWRVRVTRTLARLPEQFSSSDDPSLADEVRRALRGG